MTQYSSAMSPRIAATALHEAPTFTSRATESTRAIRWTGDDCEVRVCAREPDDEKIWFAASRGKERGLDHSDVAVGGFDREAVRRRESSAGVPCRVRRSDLVRHKRP